MRKQLPRGPLDTLSIYWCRKRFWRVSNLRGVRGLFENLENVLSPGGTLQSRARKGSNCFYLCFIGVGRGTGGFKFCGGERPF